MNPALRNQLLTLDRALLALLDERARLVLEIAPAPAAAALDDLLRRHDGPVPAGAVREFFAAVDRACETCGAEGPL